MSSPLSMTAHPDRFPERRSERVARLLSEHIVSHDLQPGDKLPPEKALAGRFGVSRAVIREAIAMLRAEGRVETVQGSGAFVRSSGAAAVEDGIIDFHTRESVGALLQLISVRRLVEGEIAALAAINRTPQQIAEIDRKLAALNLAQAEGQPGVSEDRAFHESIANACGNTYWRSIVDTLARSIEIAISVTRSNEAQRRDFTRAVNEEHAALRDAIAAGDEGAARKAAVLHMERAAERVRSADREFWIKGGARVADLPGAV